MSKKKKKVRCVECKSQYQGFCVVKRVTVSLNKSRHCDKFRFDQEKVKIKQVLPTTRVSYREKELLKKQRKEELKLLRAKLKEKEDGKEKVFESRIYKPHGTEKYPLTGDLNRFTTTGTSTDEK